MIEAGSAKQKEAEDEADTEGSPGNEEGDAGGYAEGGE
jgi:hypothetical protein